LPAYFHACLRARSFSPTFFSPNINGSISGKKQQQPQAPEEKDSSKVSPSNSPHSIKSMPFLISFQEPLLSLTLIVLEYSQRSKFSFQIVFRPLGQ
jgi:hypothetical protein